MCIICIKYICTNRNMLIMILYIYIYVQITCCIKKMVFVLKFEHVFTVIQCVSLMVEGTTWPTNKYASILFEGNHIETTQVGRQHVLRYHHFCFLLNGSNKPYLPGNESISHLWKRNIIFKIAPFQEIC